MLLRLPTISTFSSLSATCVETRLGNVGSSSIDLCVRGYPWPIVAVFPWVPIATLPLHLCHHLVGYFISWPPVCPIAEDETATSDIWTFILTWFDFMCITTELNMNDMDSSWLDILKIWVGNCTFLKLWSDGNFFKPGFNLVVLLEPSQFCLFTSIYKNTRLDLQIHDETSPKI